MDSEIIIITTVNLTLGIRGREQLMYIQRKYLLVVSTIEHSKHVYCRLKLAMRYQEEIERSKHA